jgi:tRNA nucleotidyltransferase (CCA-adding enzyme)
MLLHDIGKPSCFTVDEAGTGHFYGHSAVSRDLADGMLRRLKCGNALRENIVMLVDWHDREIQHTEAAVSRALRRLGETDLRRLLAIKRADNRGQAPDFWGYQAEIQKTEEILNRILESQACFSLKQLAVKGNDLLALGYAGPAVGTMLEWLLEQVVGGALPNAREDLLAAVEKEKKRHA